MASPRDMDNEVGEAISAFKSGRPVMIYDSDYREMETDLLGMQQQRPRSD